MEFNQENKEEATRLCSYYLKMLRGYPGDDNLEAFIELNLVFISDWTSFDWLLKKAASTLRFFPAPIEMRRIYCSRFSPADNWDTNFEDIE